MEAHPNQKFLITALFMDELRKHEGVSVRALEFAILTVGRSSEVRGATWNEIDMQSLRWTVPAARMKREKEHVVPLSGPAIELVLCKNSDDITGDGQAGCSMTHAD
jgi:integrase